MSLNSNEKLTLIVSLINDKANQTAHDILQEFQKENPSVLVEPDVVDLSRQRANSELMIRMCHFKPSPECDADALRESFEAWFADEEEALRQMCYSILREESAKRKINKDSSLSFSERYKQKVRETKMNAVEMNKMLND